jgi:hypothetical protein
MRRVLIAAAALAMFGSSAFAVSDGQYSYSKQHCSGAADNAEHPNRVEDGCHVVTVTLADGSGHEYAGWGLQQTADGDFPHENHIWFDPGQGAKYVWTFDPQSGSFDPQPSVEPGTLAAPTTGLFAYFGMDDNIDVGEHDSSELINNGPSDGGAVALNVDPAAVAHWVAMLQAANVGALLSSPAPFANAGAGSCADGICEAITSQRRVAFQGGARKHRDIANYEGKQWDPESCAGPSDHASSCSDASGTHDITYWANLEGTVYTQPGLQIYEDPDPQASPIGAYPLPALYVGSCGFVFGGGPLQVPDGPFTNSAGQFVVKTLCE